MNRSVLIQWVAFGWACFQFSLPKFLLLNSEIVRSVHLAFALLLGFLCFPSARKTHLPFRLPFKKFRFSYPEWLDGPLGVIAFFAALYLAIDYTGIGERQGNPIERDLLIGGGLVVLILEGTRRAIGAPLPTVAGIFILFSLFSEWLPDFLSYRSASLEKVLSRLTMGTEGVYGLPLDVSASTVFLFVLFGVLLERAGAGKYFTDLAYSLLGRYKGGPAKASVLASGLTGVVSGSSIANTVTTGTFTIPLMKKAGYPAVKAGAIEVAASTNGQLMPPIMGAAAFIIAEYCNMPYIEVVRAAIIPALISYVALIYITHLEASKLNLKPAKKHLLPNFKKTFLRGIHFLIPLFFLLYQLVILRHSAQLSVFYAIVALVALMFVETFWNGKRLRRKHRKSLKIWWKQVFEGFVGGSKNMVSIGLAVGCAGIIVGVVNMGLGGMITEVVHAISGGHVFSLLLVTAVFGLILGMGLPTTANYIVMASLLAPVIVTLGADAGFVIPLIAAHLFCFYFGILADDTPPVGLAAYAAAAISKADPIRTGLQGFLYDLRTAILPFMFVLNPELLLIGVHGFWDILRVLVLGLAAMFAFSSVTQDYLFVKNKAYETALLLMATFLLFQPKWVSEVAHLTPTVVIFIGIACFATVAVFQKIRGPN